MDWQECVKKHVAYRVWTDTHTDKQTDRKVKTDGPKIMFINNLLPSNCDH